MHQYVSGDDWEHEEIFTDDDEAVGNDPEEREELAPEVPAPPEIKQVCLCTSITGKFGLNPTENNFFDKFRRT